MRRIAVLVLTLLFALSSTPQVASAAAQGSGSISGVAQSSGGQTLGSYKVQLRSVQTGAIVASTTTSAVGSFAFLDLNPGSYVVEILNASGQVIGAGSVTTVVVNGNAVTNVTAPSTALVGGAIATPLLILLLAAAAAGTVGIIAAVKDEASPSR